MAVFSRDNAKRLTAFALCIIVLVVFQLSRGLTGINRAGQLQFQKEFTSKTLPTLLPVKVSNDKANPALANPILHQVHQQDSVRTSNHTSITKSIEMEKQGDANQVALDLVATRKNIKTGLLFHLLHTSGDDSFRINNMRVLESVFYHHPDAHVKIHVPKDKPINRTRFEPLLERGYHVEIESFDLVSLVNEYMATEDSSNIMDKNATRRWIQRIPELSNQTFWHIDCSDLSRLLFIYTQGGIYMDTDIILVKPLHNLTKNFMVWQWRKRRYANNAVLRFDQGNEFVGRAIAAFFVRSNTTTASWGINGPTLVSETLNKNYADCAFGKTYHPTASNVSEPQQCPVSVLPVETFYPLLYRLQAEKEMLDKKLVRNFESLCVDVLFFRQPYTIRTTRIANNHLFSAF